MTRNKADLIHALQLASQQVVDEFQAIKNEAHSKWVVDSQQLWNTQGIKLPYPNIPPPPDEREIIARAKLLIENNGNHLTSDANKDENIKENMNNCNITATVETVAVEQDKSKKEDIVEDKSKESTTIPQHKNTNIIADLNEKIIALYKPKPRYFDDEFSTATSRALPDFISAFNSIKQNFSQR